MSADKDGARARRAGLYVGSRVGCAACRSTALSNALEGASSDTGCIPPSIADRC